MSGKAYYPNNWDMYKEAPDEMFEPHTFEEVMEWKVAGWELPSSVACIVRVVDRKTGKVKEHTYQTEGHALNKVRKLMDTPDVEVTVCNHNSIHQLTTHSND
jgi:hypothetical protein